MGSEVIRAWPFRGRVCGEGWDLFRLLRFFGNLSLSYERAFDALSRLLSFPIC